MLLRSSRAAESLTKQAIFGRLAVGAAKHVGRNWKLYGGGAAMGAMTAPGISRSFQKARVGTDKRYIRAQQAGYAPRMKPGVQ